jgi:V/A-type H+-transporting ATPase subunit A
VSVVGFSPESARRAGAAVAEVVGVRENLVTVRSDHPFVKNEVAYVLSGGRRLQAELLRVRNRTADLQVFEDTRGIAVGDECELTGELLSATLGPGLLGQVYDGLQNPLALLARQHGFFLPRGVQVDALTRDRQWQFVPAVKPGDSVYAGDTLGLVEEGHLRHAIMVPFAWRQALRVEWVHDGMLATDGVAARLRSDDGAAHEVGLTQRWPVRRPLPAHLLEARLAQRLYPSEPLVTSMRLIDSFFPIAQGGTACIPGPFGAGKTVLQSLIARYADVDVVIIVACGERAGEVVETITEFPNLEDPRTGRSLMDRTVIVCNTSSMPIAARESSIYLGVTLGEYYRQMGHRVLVIADSTSRWAQALRETSGRMEEIPGEEAYPAYLDSAIKSVYERAGVLRRRDGITGSLTLVGTVSPAGGNFDEPVTQATLGTVKCFLGLSAERAYKRFYPAVDPLISWSRYLDQLKPWSEAHLGTGWTARIEGLQALLAKGDDLAQLIQVAGEEGVTLEDFVTWQKATLVDLAFLQQDAFDEVDRATSLERQRDLLLLLQSVVNRKYALQSRDQAREVFMQLTGLFRNLNYSAGGSPQYARYAAEIEALTRAHAVTR